jgi:hypothetical protein
MESHILTGCARAGIGSSGASFHARSMPMKPARVEGAARQPGQPEADQPAARVKPAC